MCTNPITPILYIHLGAGNDSDSKTLQLDLGRASGQ